MVHTSLLSSTVFRIQSPKIPLDFCRHKSIRAAIERGISNSKGSSRRRLDYIRRDRDRPIEPRALPKTLSPPRRYRPVAGGARKDTQKQTSTRPEKVESRRDGQLSFKEKGSRAVEPRKYAPGSLPYTTAASEFLYGYSVVIAALKARRRNLYNLYIHDRGRNHESRIALVSRAKQAGVKIHEVGDEWLRLMDKASSGRPHNGFILESSPLPQLPITELGAYSIKSGSFDVVIPHQSREDIQVNGTQDHYKYKSGGWKHPLILYIDGVLDEGNLGAIARSAYFLGVDAIATPTRQSAPWSHIALKASAGAAEAIPIFTVAQPSDFLSKSALRGWRIYASDAIPPGEERPVSVVASPRTQDNNEDTASDVIYTFARSTKRVADHYPVASHPTILMMGAEGTGLRTSLINQAHYKVGIRARRDVEEIGVDSLNVSVAASLLCYEFLKKPKQQHTPGDRLF
ncbi:alpha/beta knot [Zopfia rhizophila CBS 207.26]|uniref:rRNA methyltransferase 1, mitochondrial n=1 Tax=Zopfia rhizophila CBS 207.26 TaxID=1314779 RepID=A0A6A6EQG5_9PEZI|nr:alpha/beta knot [Zopfia rhizophila CBS 207.26]